MYEQRFGLNRRPFPATPDSSTYYPATSHEQALTPLLRAVAEDEGLMLLVGEPGTGKSLAGQIFLERLGENAVSAFLTNGHYPNRAALLQAILYDLRLPFDEDREQILRLRLTDCLLKNCGEGKRTVVVVDEAHLLTVEVLEEIRLLGNLEAGRKAIQFLCLAQPAIVDNVKLPRLASWNQRLAVRSCLHPLGVDESIDYVLHHLRGAGGKPEQIIDDEALETLARGAMGLPRLLNQACHQALLLTNDDEVERIDVEVAQEALTLLGLHLAEAELALDDEGDDILELRKIA